MFPLHDAAGSPLEVYLINPAQQPIRWGRSQLHKLKTLQDFDRFLCRLCFYGGQQQQRAEKVSCDLETEM